MRVRVDKYLFHGPEETRKPFFAAAQKLGIVEFIGKAKRELPAAIHTFSDAGRILRHLEPQPQKEYPTLAEALPAAQKIVALQRKLDTLAEEQRLLDQEITRVQAFGNFSRSDLAYIAQEGNRAIQFFFAKEGVTTPATERPELLYCGSAHGLDYYIGINTHSTHYDGLTEMQIEEPVGEVRARLAEAKKQHHEAYEGLKTYAPYKAFLRKALIHELNIHNLDASEQTPSDLFDGALFAVQGWVPSNKRKELQELTDLYNIAADPVTLDDGDVAPTYLDNKGLPRVGEDLVHIYDTPSNTDRDPSLWVLTFFAFFFGFILNDAGYGLVLLATSLYLSWRFFKRGGLVQRFLKLCLILSATCIIWGTLTTSFFGMEIAPNNPLRKVSLTTWLAKEKADYIIAEQGPEYTEMVEKIPELKDQTDWTTNETLLASYIGNILMELALFIGAIHVIISLLRVIDRNWAGVGWILFIVGCYLHFPSVLQATSLIHFLFGVPKVAGAALGVYLLFGGLIAAIIISPIQNKLAGLAEVAVVIQIFADVLSYLRLYALALAGGMMSATFNDLGAAAGPIFGTLIIIGGHVINITLGIMGGVIHGLRLNFLEWYHYSFEGGGKMLNPLRLLT